MDGVLVVDKPLGPTSHDVVARVRRALRTPRIGHTGTLDPLATGVLPLVVGRATRLASLLSGDDKEYAAGIRLGLATDTYDAAGLATRPSEPPPGIGRAEIEAVLDQFRGTFDQMPPPFSAKKIGGVRAYELARRRTAVQPASVSVTVRDLTMEGYEEGLVRVRVRSSAGFYVRSLAHDLGQRLGCGAYLETLRRVKAGDFAEDSAIALDDVEREGSEAGRLIIPLERLLPHIPAVVLNERGLGRASHGNEIMSEDATVWGPPGSPKYRLLDADGRLVAVAESRPGGLLHPVTVLV
jgi:tRNA pseudouridine55 synthase